jgi:hypothetical protein
VESFDGPAFFDEADKIFLLDMDLPEQTLEVYTRQ